MSPTRSIAASSWASDAGAGCSLVPASPSLININVFFVFGSHLSQRHPLRIVLGPEGNDGG